MRNIHKTQEKIDLKEKNTFFIGVKRVRKYSKHCIPVVRWKHDDSILPSVKCLNKCKIPKGLWSIVFSDKNTKKPK